MGVRSYPCADQHIPLCHRFLLANCCAQKHPAQNTTTFTCDCPNHILTLLPLVLRLRTKTSHICQVAELCDGGMPLHITVCQTDPQHSYLPTVKTYLHWQTLQHDVFSAEITERNAAVFTSLATVSRTQPLNSRHQ